MAGTYYNPGRVIDTSVGEFTKGIEDIEKSLAKQAELKENEEKNRIKLQNKLNEDLLGLSSSVNEFPEYAEITIDDQVKSTLQDKYEEVYRLGVDSIGKDNSAYLKAKRELEVAAKEAGLFLAAFNSEGQKFEDSESLELDQVGAALLAQDTNRVDFIRDYNKGGSNIKPELVNGVWVFKMKDEDGKDFIVNSRAYLNEKQPFLNYLEDDTEKLDLIYENYADNYKNLEQTRKNKTLSGEEITLEEDKSYEEANAFLIDALKNDKNLVDPETAKLTYWFPSLFLIGLDASVFLAIFGHYFLVKTYSVYFLILLFDSFFKNGLKVAILCIITSFTQFLGYGLGFLESQFFNKK